MLLQLKVTETSMDTVTIRNQVRFQGQIVTFSKIKVTACAIPVF